MAARCTESRNADVAYWLQADINSPEIEVCFTPNSGHSLGRQIQAPTCRRRNGLADTIKVGGIGLVHVALANERLDHFTGHLNRHHEAALLAAGSVAALALGGGGGDGGILVTGPGKIAVAYQPRGVALDGAESIKRMLGSS